MSTTNALVVFGVIWLSLWCGWVCGKYDERHRQKTRAVRPPSEGTET